MLGLGLLLLFCSFVVFACFAYLPLLVCWKSAGRSEETIESNKAEIEVFLGHPATFLTLRMLLDGTVSQCAYVHPHVQQYLHFC